ncbi:hypothetical protein BIU82_17050 [Arthrobacter sp. SW1]|uniref:hypothetical protein n=1 Tax=Arthrobacter sp. SW1 TaxID=1920889 RepID=UPI000877D35D|nr:hypothetical protein [Arthrobacter sp. SW1]OFI38887.1 hypothetical protein BIU82_17050 [Arthrobacter sp. SW1]
MDATTIALNLTFFGTLGVAFLMFLALGLCMVVTLVLAGIARLLSIIVLAMVGIFPKNDAGPVVHLPRSHGRPAGAVPAGASDSATSAGTTTAPPAPERPPAAAVAGTAGAEQTAPEKPTRSIPWKKLASPKEWPELKTKIAEGTAAAVGNQTKHHPLLLAATPEPPVLNEKWAAAVAEADAREEAREEAAEEAREETREAAAESNAGSVTAHVGAQHRP